MSALPGHRLTSLRVRVAAPRLACTGTAARLVDSVLGDRKAAGRLRRYGLHPVGLVEAPVADLLHQRPLLCEMVLSDRAEPVEPVDRFFTRPDGALDFSIRNGPAFRTLEADAEAGGPLPLRETPYWAWHAGLREAGINAETRSDVWIAAKLDALRRLREEIAARGYRYRTLSYYIWVVAEPIAATRYGLDYRREGLEVVDGHHRAAAAVHLGLPSVHALLVEDVAVRTPFGIPLASVARAG